MIMKDLTSHTIAGVSELILQTGHTEIILGFGDLKRSMDLCQISLLPLLFNYFLKT